MHKVQASGTFNLRAVQRDYIGKCLQEQAGHKYLVLDPFTMECLSVAYFRSELFEFSVFDSIQLKAADRLTVAGDTEAVFLLRPNDENQALLAALLPNCPFSKVFLCRPA